MWKWYAVLAAFFAALTAILAKAGVRGVNSNLATAIRTAVVLMVAWGIVFAAGNMGDIKTLSRQNWLFLILSGVATGLSWIFYFKALQLGEVSKVAPIDKLSVAFTILLGILIFHEPIDAKVLIGGGCIVAGSLIMLS